MDQVTQVRERIDIVSYLSEFMTLGKAGKNFKGLCPFHGEKTPSFMVTPERQRWHCFGCGKGGDAFSFLMDYEHVEFPEALKILAQRAGIQLVQSHFATESSQKKEKIYLINKQTAEYYHYLLTKHPIGKQALAYLEERKVDPKIIESFSLGFAPPKGRALTTYLLQRKQHSSDELLEAGVVSVRGRDTFDFFRGRLMFPLIDHRDNIVGFSGRILGVDEKAPKYINTRETLVYHKGETFFGLNMTKDAIRRENQALLVEGEFDVLSCFQHGVANVVAVKGTALTESQVSLLSRYAQKVTVCFDGDRAGQEAIKRSLPILEKKGLQTTVVVIPGGKDPDESLKTSVTAFKIAVKEDLGVYEYLLSQAFKEQNASTVEGKQAISVALLPIFSEIKNEIIKEHFLKKLSTQLDTSYESVTKEMERMLKPQSVKVTVTTLPIKRSREEKLEEYLLSLILQSHAPLHSVKLAFEHLEGVMNEERAIQKILTHIFTYGQTHEQLDPQEFAHVLPTELADTFDKCLLLPLPQFVTQAAFEEEVLKSAKQLQEVYLRQKIKVVGQLLKEKEKEGKTEEVETLKAQFSQYMAMLQKP